MEIKRGISQMAEYPNREINYVVPADGQMYYVLENGVLNSGAVIATLDPKRAIDSNIVCDSIGVFKEDGSILIDFDKKDIKVINDELLLVVNANPTTETVINAVNNMNDEISKTMMRESSTSIVDRMMIEMGITGEIIFSDNYGEANVYKLDSYNNKIGIDCSFIGKNDTNIYFHTNDAATSTSVVSINGEVKEEEKNEVVEENTEPTTPEFSEFNPTSVNMDMEEEENQDLKLDISQNILEGFIPSENTIEPAQFTEPENSFEPTDISTIENNMEQEETTEEVNSFETEFTPVENSFEPEEYKPEENTFEPVEFKEEINNEIEIPIEENEEKEVEEENNFYGNTESDSDDTLDNAIEIMKKMIEETNKLKDKIASLDKEIEEKNKVLEELEDKIKKQESKKNELSNLLSEANEVLETIN